ncbi:MAG: BrnT family toxin [Deltaproteobacteria bacterium]|nr:BrnT family toxin [Deltaproteobacteria bacterium]
MKYFSWDNEKNERLKRERGISFEDVVFYIEQGHLLDILEHPNQQVYPGQRIFIVEIEDYVYLVPFVETEDEVFTLREVIRMPRLTKEEKGLLVSYEKGEWKSVKRLDMERQRYRGYARATFLKDRRINIRISAKDLEGIRKKALQEGIPYQTLISSIIHKYVSARLVEKLD